MKTAAAKKIPITAPVDENAKLAAVPKGFNELLDKLNDIPTLPVVANMINDLINDPNSSAADIAEVLKKDQVMTAKVLKLINSPYYNIPGGVTDVKRALAFLGFNTLAQLVLGMSVFSIFPKDQNDDFPLMQFWRHALGTAVCANVIAKHVKYAKPEEAFTCGLLHDIGKIVMFTVARETLLSVVRKARDEKTSFNYAETVLDVPTHAFLGEHIAKKWGLPQIIRSAIRYHHQDVRELTTILASEKPAIQIVTLANVLTVNFQIGHSGDYSDGGLQAYMYETLGMKISELEQIKEATQDEFKKASIFLSVF